jgi:DNA-directed RNA polymerase, beta subunit/140 kD subunit
VRCSRTSSSTPSATTWPRSVGTRCRRSCATSTPSCRSKKYDLTIPNADPEAGPVDYQLSKADILATVSYIVKLHNNDPDYYPDDIDHFGNRRVRSVGELIQNQVRVGLRAWSASCASA